LHLTSASAEPTLKTASQGARTLENDPPRFATTSGLFPIGQGRDTSVDRERAVVVLDHEFALQKRAVA
jgi:hypothetical protein